MYFDFHSFLTRLQIQPHHQTKTTAMRIAMAVSLAVGLMMASASASTAAGKTTHLLAIGICPAWKPQSPEVCKRDVETVSGALKTRLGLADDNIHLVINQQATAAGLKDAMARLDGLGPLDRLIIYANLHAGSLDRNKPAGPDNDVFILWTDEKPAVLAFAVAEGSWIQASDFAAWVHAIPAGEVVFMLDACESGAVTPLFIHDHPANDPARPDAVVTSAKSDQFANFAADQSMSLFSQTLAVTIGAASGTLGDAVAQASSATAEAAVPICDGMATDLKKYGLDPLSCRQQPTVHDPDGLLTQIPLD